MGNGAKEPRLGAESDAPSREGATAKWGAQMAPKEPGEEREGGRERERDGRNEVDRGVVVN